MGSAQVADPGPERDSTSISKTLKTVNCLVSIYVPDTIFHQWQHSINALQEFLSHKTLIATSPEHETFYPPSDHIPPPHPNVSDPQLPHAASHTD